MKRINIVMGILLLLLGLAISAQALDGYKITTYVKEWPLELQLYTIPSGIAVDADGHVYVSLTNDAGYQKIQVYDGAGTPLAQFCDTYGSSDGQCARLLGVSIGPDGLIYVSDALNWRIQKFRRSGSGSSLSFSFDSKFSVTDYPYRTAFSPAGDVYVALYWGHRVEEYPPSGGLPHTFPYSSSTLPQGVAVDSQGYLYVATHWAPGYTNGDFIDKYDPAGNWVGRFGSHGRGDGQFWAVGGIFIDENDTLYACDGENHRIQVFQTNGTFLGWYGKGTAMTGWHEPGSGETGVPGTGPGEFGAPVDIAIDKDGYVYVTEDWNDRVQKLYRSKPPTAEAGPDQTVEQTSTFGADITLDGSGSSGSATLTYDWTWPGGSATGVNPTVTMSPGTATVTLTVSSGGASATDTVNITVQDTRNPNTTAMITGVMGNNDWYVSDVVMNLIATDSGSGIKEIHYSTNGSNVVVSGESASFNLTSSGTHSISYYAVDNAGNSEDPHTLNVNIDKTLPAISITGPQATSYLHTATFNVSWSATDILSGIATESGTLDGKAVTKGQVIDLFYLSLGSHTVVVNASDNAGNTSSTPITFQVVADSNSLFSATEWAFALGWITKQGVCDSLETKVNAARASIEQGQYIAAKNQLNAYLNHLDAQRGKAVNQQAYDLLRADVLYLIGVLP